MRGYTREAGVRSLEREIAAVARKVARRLAEGQREPVRVTADNVVEYLGRPRFFDEVAERTDRPGVATGLAWTPTGGDVLFVEATMMPSTRGAAGPHRHARRRHARERPGGRSPTCGRMPRRSASIPSVFEGKTIHVHVPAGAIPKDGPVGGRDDGDGAGLAGHRAAGARATWR